MTRIASRSGSLYLKDLKYGTQTLFFKDFVKSFDQFNEEIEKAKYEMNQVPNMEVTKYET
jgi:hypothetical protein